MCGGSPLIMLPGRLHRRGDIFSCRGDYTGEEIIYILRSPLSEPDLFRFVSFRFISCRGDSQERSNYTLVLPSLKPEIWGRFTG